MTTKPASSRPSVHDRSGSRRDDATAAGTEDGLGTAPFPTAREPASAGPGGEGGQGGETAGHRGGAPAAAGSGKGAGADNDSIRREGLTGRQLRMARRLAHRHGMSPRSDIDAVRLLRKADIDPFQRVNMLRLVEADPKGAPAAHTAAAAANVSASPAETRAIEIDRIQTDIIRRRRRRMLALCARLAVFVLAPTLVAAWYYVAVATPMYATHTEFVIQQADGPPAAGRGGITGATGAAVGLSQDAITVQSYLQSREAMLRLDDDLGFRAHFQDPAIDWWQRMPADATNEAAYAHFTDRLQIGYDPTEGVIRMQFVAATPGASAAFSRALIGYAEEQVDQLTARLRADQMAGATRSLEGAETAMRDAQRRVLDLQEQAGILDPASEGAALMAQIGVFETQLAEKRLQLQQMLDNPRPNVARVDGATGEIDRLETLVTELRGDLTRTTADGSSLARITGDLRMAEADLVTRQQMLHDALRAVESARAAANRQVRYLAVGVNPTAPDEATYPRAAQSTFLAFLAFGGIYLMVSLTAAILREQV